MEDLIQRLDNWLQSHRPDYYAELAPGLSDEEIAAFEKALGLELPMDFKLFYKWKNGDIEDEGTPLFYATGLMNIKEIIGFCQMMSQPSVEGYLLTEEEWHPKWIPFLNDRHSTRYCLDMFGSFGGKPGQVIEVVGDMPNSDNIWHESFYKWLETLVLAFERGLFGDYDPEEGMYPIDEDAYLAFCQENNPGYPITILDVY